MAEGRGRKRPVNSVYEPEQELPLDGGGGSMSGQFYHEQAADSVVVDPMASPADPPNQERLAELILEYDGLFQKDLTYAEQVCGTSQLKLQDFTLVSRNEHSVGFSQTDLDRCNQVAWYDIVKRRFLPAEKGDIQNIGKRLVDVIQTLNLEVRGFIVLGLHPRVESAESQVVLELMALGFLDREWSTRGTALRLRRHPSLFVPFALAVGALTCHNFGLSIGAAETRYNRDLQDKYRRTMFSALTATLHHYQDRLAAMLAETDGTDYVLHLRSLRIVRPKRVLLEPRPDPCDRRCAGANGSNVNVQIDSGAQGGGNIEREMGIASQDIIEILEAGFHDVQRDITALSNRLPPIDIDDLVSKIRADISEELSVLKSDLDDVKTELSRQIDSKTVDICEEIITTRRRFNELTHSVIPMVNEHTSSEAERIIHAFPSRGRRLWSGRSPDSRKTRSDRRRRSSIYSPHSRDAFSGPESRPNSPIGEYPAFRPISRIGATSPSPVGVVLPQADPHAPGLLYDLSDEDRRRIDELMAALAAVNVPRAAPHVPHTHIFPDDTTNAIISGVIAGIPQPPAVNIQDIIDGVIAGMPQPPAAPPPLIFAAGGAAPAAAAVDLGAIQDMITAVTKQVNSCEINTRLAIENIVGDFGPYAELGFNSTLIAVINAEHEVTRARIRQLELNFIGDGATPGRMQGFFDAYVGGGPHSDGGLSLRQRFDAPLQRIDNYIQHQAPHTVAVLIAQTEAMDAIIDLLGELPVMVGQIDDYVHRCYTLIRSTDGKATEILRDIRERTNQLRVDFVEMQNVYVLQTNTMAQNMQTTMELFIAQARLRGVPVGVPLALPPAPAAGGAGGAAGGAVP